MFGGSALTDGMDRYSFVAYAHEIYQAWCAMQMGNALDLEPTGGTLGAQQPAFQGAEFAIYYDTVVPDAVLRSWRQGSAVPDALKPDVVVHRLSGGKVFLADAKYRNSGNYATEDSRKEVMSYMAAFGLDAVGILYPPGGGNAEVRRIEGSGNVVVEVPAKPGHVPSPEDLRDLVNDLLREPSY
jgi:hypothetical protein